LSQHANKLLNKDPIPNFSYTCLCLDLELTDYLIKDVMYIATSLNNLSVPAHIEKYDAGNKTLRKGEKKLIVSQNKSRLFRLGNDEPKVRRSVNRDIRTNEHKRFRRSFELPIARVLLTRSSPHLSLLRACLYKVRAPSVALR